MSTPVTAINAPKELLGYHVSEPKPVSPEADAAALFEAMKGMGTQDKILINILTQRTPVEIAMKKILLFF